MCPKYLLSQRTSQRGREEGHRPRNGEVLPREAPQKELLSAPRISGSSGGSHLSISLLHPVGHLHKHREAILGAIPKIQGSGAGRCMDCSQNHSIQSSLREPQAVTQGHLLVVVGGWIEITGYQVLHMVLLFSAAKMVPSSRPGASGLQRTVYRHRHKHDNGK